MPLSPYVEEPLNSKVIKSFVPEQRSRKCFSCFEIPMFSVIYIYIYIYGHYMDVSHIAISWLCYTKTLFRGVLLLWRDAVGVFYSPNRLD